MTHVNPVDLLKIMAIAAGVFYVLVVGMITAELVSAHALDRRDQRRRLAQMPDVDACRLADEAERWLTEQEAK